MDAALGLSLGHTLHTMYARLELEDAVAAVARHGEIDFLVAAARAFADAGHFDFPALVFAEFGVHAEEVAGKEAGLVAACARTNLYDSVLVVLRVLGNHHHADVLFQLFDARLGGVQLLLGHLAHLVVFLRGQDFLGFIDIGFQRLVFLEGHDDRLQVLVVLVELHELLHVGSHGRVGELFAHLLPAVLYRFKFFSNVHESVARS